MVPQYDHSTLRAGGALLAGMNTASEYGFGAVIAALPGFLVVANALGSIPNPLVNEAVTVTALAGITGSASGGMSIALAAMAETFIANANAAGIPMEVLHRVAAMASGGMDTLPHNGAVITLLAVTGLTHRQAYKDIFAITLIKTSAVFVVIAAFWRANHRAMAGFRALDAVTLRMSIVVAGLVVFIPFTTRAISSSDLPLATALRHRAERLVDRCDVRALKYERLTCRPCPLRQSARPPE